MKKRKKKKKTSIIEIIFCILSLIFIIGCIIYYMGRFIYLYIDNNKVNNTGQLAVVIKNNNSDNNNFKLINKNYYFIDNADNNYLKYSNILWRIIKVDKDNNITLISDDILTSLAYGNQEYKDSYINKWLNKQNEDNTGILENNLNNISKYLNNIDVCLDKTNKINNNTCKETYKDGYLGLLNIEDYVNIGADKSYINNDQSFYLSGLNKENKVWVIDTDNKLTTSDGEEIYGVKTTIKIKSTTSYISGDGTSNNPYIIEDKNSYFGSYVNLDNDTWRVINDNDTTLDLISINSNIKESYNTSSYTYNTKSSSSIGYYLNNTYLNKLTYKSIINEANYYNGFYGSDNDYNYIDTMKDTIKCKVGLPSIGNIIFYEDNNDFMSMTGTSNNGNLIYMFNNKELYEEAVKNENNVLPIININKDLLTSGSGTKDDPYKRS